MIDNKDFDFIKNKFDNDGIETPESLSADNMMKMLEREDAGQTENASTDKQPDIAVRPNRRPVKKRPWFRPVISVAACATLVISLIPFMNFNHNDSNDVRVTSGDLQYFASYEELNSKIKSMSPKTGHLLYQKNDDTLALGNGDMAVEEDMAEAPGSDDESTTSAESAVGGTRPESHSETYTQVEGVDEADIVKTDGKYIYFSSYEENQIIIAKASRDKAKRVAAIGSGKIGSFIEDMYVSGNKLIVIGYDSTKHDDAFTTVTIFDITAPENPEMVRKYSQPGNLLSSRLIRNTLCLVTNDYIYVSTPGGFIPKVYYNEDAKKMPIEDICCLPDATSPAYTVVGCIDISAKKSDQNTIKTKAVLGGSSEIYCNDENLYITGSVMKSRYGDCWTYDDVQTNILKVSIKDGKVKYKKTAVVDGTINNQFSMDERDGHFKVAVTDTVDGQDTNNLYIMDKNMKEVACVRNFARGEHIEAVRYVKDKAYVITYEQTDPLFIIDLADPTDPVIEGHVKITGFSTLLVPAGKDYLLGLGFSTEDIEDIDMEATDGVKVALFDIRNPSNPKVADAEEFKGMYSEVQYNHKALLVGPGASYYAIPYEDDDNMGILAFEVKSGKLENFKKLETSEAVMRCIYIGDYIYGICLDDSIEGFKVQ